MVAFLAILGPLITASIMLALVTSFSMLWVARRTITTAGGSIQKAKMQALLSVQSLWDHAFFGNLVTSQQPTAQTKANLAKFFRQTERFKLLEQGISCFPIFLSMGVLYAAINHQVHLGQVLLPALVAVLPRSLQLFQNVHTVNTYSSQYLLLSAKLRNLRNFPAQLERRDIGANIDKDGIAIQDVYSGNKLNVDMLITQLKHDPTGQHGRFRITGRNGAGKSSLLRDLKALLPDAVLLGPDIHLLPIEVVGSTGQIQRQTLHAMLEQGVSTLLLDEWDANLDQVNTTSLDGQIDELSKRALVIEVRHNRA
jgi:ABC-type transport system involved in cytochrome bd biosynthesis fused ATPase/permease subunit